MAKSKQAVPPRSKPRPVQAEQKAASSFSFEKFLIWAQLIVISLVFWYNYSNIYDAKPDMNGDNFTYYLLGQRIAHGQGFTNATEIHHAPHTHVSPGYPVILSILMKLLGENPETITSVNGVFMYVALLFLYFLVRRLAVSQALAFVVCILCALNPHLLRSATIMMSETPFLLMSLMAIYFFVRGVQDSRGIKSIWLYASVVAMAACYYTKTTAVALVAGACVQLLWTRDWRRLGVVVITFALLALPWSIRNSIIRDPVTGAKLGNSYMGQLKQISPYKPELGNLTTATFIERITNNFDRYVSNDIPASVLAVDENMKTSLESFRRSLDEQKKALADDANREAQKPGMTEEGRKEIQNNLDRKMKRIDTRSPISFWILGIAIISLTLFGLFRLRNFALFLLVYFAGTLAILLIWPDVWGGIRFIMPLVPIAVFLSLYAVTEIVAMLVGERIGSYIPYAFILLGVIYSTPISELEAEAQQPLPTNYVDYFEAAKWAKQHTPKDAIFSARKMDMFIYYSDRMCIGDRPSLDDKEVMDFFRQNKVDYVVIESLGFQSTQKYLIPAVQKNMDKFQVIYQQPATNPTTYILKFNRN